MLARSGQNCGFGAPVVGGVAERLRGTPRRGIGPASPFGGQLAKNELSEEKFDTPRLPE